MNRLLALLLALAPIAVLAAVPDYEQRLIERALEKTGRALDPAPEGKRVEEILVASEEIFALDDLWPAELNVFHRLTRESVVRRQVLLEVGAPFCAELAGETERNLRAHFVFAVARVVAVEGQAGGTALLVVTKDRWSLRLNSDFAFVGTLLQFLQLRPTEQNFLGLDQQVLLDFILKLDTLQLGQAFQDKRLWGSQVALSETAALVFNRHSMRLEGSAGSVVFGRKLVSLEDTWALTAQGLWNVRTWRVFRGPSVWQLEGPGGPVPNVFEGRNLNGQVSYTRSFGRAFKTNVSGGVGAYARRYSAPVDTGLSDEQRAFLEEGYLPASESAIYLVGQVRAYLARFQVLHDRHTFSLSEDFQLGPQVVLWARWANPAFFSPSRYLEWGGWARYRLLAGDDLASVVVAASARAQGGWVNRHFAAEVSNITPSLYLGRLVTRAIFELRALDRDPRPILLGGGNGLRGAAPEALAGRNVALWNCELRTRPVEFQTVYLGGVLFWDAGTAFDDAPSFTHTLGVGLRILLPQFNQETIRIDFGWVLGAASPISVDRFSGSFGQVTDYRPAMLDEP